MLYRARLERILGIDESDRNSEEVWISRSGYLVADLLEA
ncbi:hypothetical protein OMCYN_01837 [cyanobiont of Ornithocercus magnificus]|nr:hypothetical protein OMCYN_01837 [cyanobiont of Ornithocercus magnificus]